MFNRLVDIIYTIQIEIHEYINTCKNSFCMQVQMGLQKHLFFFWICGIRMIKCNM